MQEINAVTVQSLIGARVLIGSGASYGGTPHNLEEVEILEVSPAGTYVRIRNVHGTRTWRRVADIRLLERLVPLEPDPSRVLRKDVAERVEALELELRKIRANGDGSGVAVALNDALLALGERVRELELRQGVAR